MKSKTVFREDKIQTKALIRAGKRASQTARRASKALGLSITYIKDGIIYEEKDGVVTKKGAVEHYAEAPFEVKKGSILYVK